MKKLWSGTLFLILLLSFQNCKLSVEDIKNIQNKSRATSVKVLYENAFDNLETITLVRSESGRRPLLPKPQIDFMSLTVNSGDKKYEIPLEKQTQLLELLKTNPICLFSPLREASKEPVMCAAIYVEPLFELQFVADSGEGMQLVPILEQTSSCSETIDFCGSNHQQLQTLLLEIFAEFQSYSPSP